MTKERLVAQASMVLVSLSSCTLRPTRELLHVALALHLFTKQNAGVLCNAA